MRFEECDSSPNFYVVRGLSKGARNFIQYSVNPTLRYFDKMTWFIHRSKVVDLAAVEYSVTGNVDYSALDQELKTVIDTDKKSWTVKQPIVITDKKTAAYKVLHLQPDAPESVVKAVWKHLASIHHPDTGGDAEVFKKYLDAYNILKS